MTKEDALVKLRAIAEGQKPDATPICDEEQDHCSADAVLLDLIGDDEITAAFEAIRKWYA
jgi:hypothetical protein